MLSWGRLVVMVPNLLAAGIGRSLVVNSAVLSTPSSRVPMTVLALLTAVIIGWVLLATLESAAPLNPDPAFKGP